MAQLDIKNCNVYLRDGYTGPTDPTGAINNVLADPVTAPTASATGGGATGGLLAAGDYLLSYTYVTALGETLRSNDSTTLTVGATNIPRVTFPALPTGAVSRKLYISTDGGNRASEKLYASGITALTYDMAIAAPGITNPPSVSTAGLSYAVGTTTIAVDGFSGALVTGDYFGIDGNQTRYLITSHTETLGATTSITFTPALVTAGPDNGVVAILPHHLQIRIGEGNASWTEKKMRTYVKDRGILDTVRNGDQDPVEVKLDATWVFLKASTGQTISIHDALKQRGEAAGWVSSSSDPCEPYCVDIVIEYTPPCTTEQMEIYTIRDFRYEELGADLKAGQLSISGKANVNEVDVTRVTVA
jgi:hypothetical protein